MNGLLNSLRGLGALRLAAMAGVAAVLVGALLYLTTRLTSPEFALLYGDLSPQDSAQIIAQLEGSGVPYTVRGDGSQILVPSDQVGEVRIRMAGQGLPSGGSVGYEIFDNPEGFGTTSFVQNVNLLRALEGELARTIGAFANVSKARVHLVLPRREIFQRNPTEPTASVFVQMRGAGRLGRDEVAAVQHLVAAAVPGLQAERVAVVDGRGTLVAGGDENPDTSGAIASRADEFRRGVENRLKATIVDLLESSVGYGKVRAEVAAEIDFDRVTVTSETFDPDSQVVRSSQTVEEAENSAERANNVSVANNLPDASPSQGGTQSNSSRTEETTNFEISKIVRNQVQEVGDIERLSVAVLVDGTYSTDADGNRQYQPRSDDELERLATLVRSAIGFNADRGDRVEVVNMQFAPMTEPEGFEAPFLGLSKADYFKIAEIIVLALVSILVILLVLRPLVSRVFTLSAGEAAAAGAGAGGGTAAIGGPAGDGVSGYLPGGGGGGGAGGGSGMDEEIAMVDMDRVEGRVQASTIKKLAEIVDKHPDEALGILRAWMADSGS